jgi:Ran GTPase-activating protein (RanGAP) involved in mRNA processing and transport
MATHYQQIEHQTGLIIFPDDTTTAVPTTNNNNVVIAATATPNLPPAVIKALRSLRDNNPSLQRKLNHGIDNNSSSSAMDESLSYWNRYQEMVILSTDNNELIGVNLGGLMVRLVNCVPFFQVIEDEKMTSLTTINFGGTDVGMDNLVEGVKLLSEDTKATIHGLYLGGCGIGCRKGTDHLKQVLKLLSKNIQTLDLRYNDLEGKDWEDLEKALASASNLKILHLEGNVGKCQGAAAIGKVLAATNINLKELYLGANQIGTTGAKSLAEGLRNNTCLQKLYLEGNSIGDEGAIALRDVLLDQRSRQCKVLEHLYVDNNGLGKEAATTLGRAVNSETMIDGSLFD